MCVVDCYYYVVDMHQVKYICIYMYIYTCIHILYYIYDVYIYKDISGRPRCLSAGSPTARARPLCGWAPSETKQPFAAPSALDLAASS